MVVVEQGLGLPAGISGRTAVLIDFFDPLREVAGTVEAAGVVEGEFRGGKLVGERGEEGSRGIRGGGGLEAEGRDHQPQQTAVSGRKRDQE